MPLADPHCHTIASDGMVTPSELVEAAVNAHLDLIAVTDHDTMDSVKEVQERGLGVGLSVVAGQEITTRWPAQTHVVGWFLEKAVQLVIGFLQFMGSLTNSLLQVQIEPAKLFVQLLRAAFQQKCSCGVS